MITIKHNSYKALLLCVLLARAAAHGAVGFVVSPETITNDFVGQLTLSITNLTPGQTIDVRAYADLNGNGLVDPGEPIIINFPVTDGQMPTIGGVRNVNLGQVMKTLLERKEST